MGQLAWLVSEDMAGRTGGFLMRDGTSALFYESHPQIQIIVTDPTQNP